MQIHRARRGLTQVQQDKLEAESNLIVRTQADIDALPLDELLQPISAMVFSAKSCFINGTHEIKSLGRVRSNSAVSFSNKSRAK